jgi:hypothetical protein
VEGLVGILHGGEEGLVVVVLVGVAAAIAAVAVACSDLPHSYCFLMILEGEWMWSSATHSSTSAHPTSSLSLHFV